MVQINLCNISKSFGSAVVLNDISLDISSGSTTFFVGPSGCGKTTLLRIIAGLENCDSGRVLFDNIDVTDIPGSQRNIGMVFQQYCLWPHMTVEENLWFGLKIKKYSPDLILQLVNETLNLVSLQGYNKRFPHQLSGGQQQRVALARAIIQKPKVLLMDEPLSNLDSAVKASIREELKKIIKEIGVTTIIVSHDVDDAKDMATQVVRFSDGKVSVQ
jgi:ABC-type sugar transport system ATPase subunit